MRKGSSLAPLEALLRAGDYARAAAFLVSAARSGEPEALAELANWRIVGDIVQRDLAVARDLLGRAAAGGDREAALLHLSFLASGTGGRSDWQAALTGLRALKAREPRARAQLRLIDAMSLDAQGYPARPLKQRELSASPKVIVGESLFTQEECAYLVAAGVPMLQPSVVVDPVSGRMIPHPVRKSDAAIFGVYSEDLVVSALNKRIAALSGTHPAQGEPLQLLRYGPGGEYRAHMDALGNEPNQRIATVLVYLVGGFEGGETRFLRTGLSFTGSPGDALLFLNTTANGSPDPMALHAGMPVTRGTKIIATRWIRQRPFTYPPPRPLLAGPA